MKKLLILALAAIGLSGCNTTGDPMQGGFFSNDAAAYQRIDQKRAHLESLQAEQAGLRSSL